ncbi:MAG: hypothetical protein AUK35_02930 [Zetaproteobacteria bacterium CG2_30_46_52]|nr:MAG: hypothetical protein AUK35_02930 [Zetaproteobacteria bacterium CG2_30_46_52]
MKVGIAGAGAVGCFYGAMLQQGGVDTVYLTRGEHLRALQTNGLLVVSFGTSKQINVAASDDAASLSDCDVILLACKTTGLETMCEQLSQVVSKNCMLLTMQNGVEAPEVVQRYFPKHAVIAASAFIGVRIERPGVINHSAAGHIRLGRYENKDESAKQVLDDLIQTWIKSGVDAAEPEDVHVMLWHKMMWNCGFNAITALTRRFAKDIANEPDTARWVSDVMLETLHVAKAMGVALPQEVIAQHIALTLKAGEVKTSMWQDMEHGRPTEIAAMNGYVAKQAKALGIETPVNDLLTSLIKAADIRLM